MSRKAILDFVDARVPNISSEEEESTYSSQRERNRRKEDLIESLMTYPSKRNLPEEPFVGRVRAALNHIREKNKSGRTRIENRFREAIKDEEEPLELFSIANEIASEDPVRALGMLEHAVSVCNYLGRMEKARLIASMKTLYSKGLPAKLLFETFFSFLAFIMKNKLFSRRNFSFNFMNYYVTVFCNVHYVKFSNLSMIGNHHHHQNS